ncbi:MAG: N-acetyltransferase [Rhodobacteraceae bacterium]|nr:MAG: N-acetyltransferase [Paracoccaceae bacterium]
MTAVPVIETARLRLRAPTAADFAAVGAFLASPRACFIGGPYDAVQAWRLFAASVGAWTLQGFGYWAVDERDGGGLVGAVGLQQPPDFPEIEFGWDLYDGFEGRGYATEAATAARDWAFGPGGLATLVSYIDPANAASIRVAERLGARRDPSAPCAFPGDLVYRHSPEGDRA